MSRDRNFSVEDVLQIYTSFSCSGSVEELLERLSGAGTIAEEIELRT
jgi:hypothetical protein